MIESLPATICGIQRIRYDLSAMDLLQSIKTKTVQPLPTAQIKKSSAQIYWAVQKASRDIRTGNFSRIQETDLEAMFDHYDQIVFGGDIKQLLQQVRHPLTFRLSGKMTRAGGKTTREETYNGRKLLNRKYEIAISTTLLFQTFQNDPKPVNVTGVLCHDRLQALQRIMEHEIIHLVEMIAWYHSDCYRTRFKSITRRLFGHSESTHQLTTVDERALAEFGIQVGDAVSFAHEGRRYRGFVNRITKRATILVPYDRGELFSDGKRYAKFYVPIQNLSLDKKSA